MTVTLAPMPDPFPVPIGLRLNQAARAVGRALDEALAGAGGSLPVWLILLNLKIRRPGTQRKLAEAVGIREATLTHHLNAMDATGLITRTRDTANRRIQLVKLTEEGETGFPPPAPGRPRLRRAAARRRNRGGDSDADHSAHPPDSERGPTRSTAFSMGGGTDHH